MAARRPILVRLSDEEREKLAAWARAWNVPLAAAIRRITREYPEPPPDKGVTK